ncbi:hypothetical protein [Mesorhizobium sp. WSM2239]|uniref:Lipoprotein n=2 Tax=unclassified Mesorhizobium TaxID=325217 RepID=A0AAU8D4J3_9HYPH
MNNCRFIKGFALTGFILAAAGCQSGDSGTVLNVGGDSNAAGETKVLESELRAYCPPVTLREGTAYFNTYAKGGQDDPTKVLYQASITDVTRTCRNAGGTMTMNVAVAGKVVPGPAGAPGNVIMPIRVAVVRGDEVLYSQLHKYQVPVGDASSATQFVFNDTNVSFPSPSGRDVEVFAGYDEGPPKKQQ